MKEINYKSELCDFIQRNTTKIFEIIIYSKTIFWQYKFY